jgi:hypothetical protein
MPTPFKTLLASIHRDAVRCALADFDADRDGREPDQRIATYDAARECAVALDTHPALGVEYWLRCYDQMAATVREPLPPYVTGQRVVITAGQHRGRLGTVEVGTTPATPTIVLDPGPGHVHPQPIRPTQPLTMTAWVQ